MSDFLNPLLRASMVLAVSAAMVWLALRCVALLCFALLFFC